MNPQEVENSILQVSRAAQLAAILEVSAEKPGNVSQVNEFSDSSYLDFLCGSLALGPGISESVRRGLLAASDEFSFSEIKIGELIRSCVESVQSAHQGGNTHLGMITLMVPLAAGVGVAFHEKNLRQLPDNIGRIIEKSTVKDSLNFYQALKIAKAGGLEDGLKQPEISFSELMKLSSDRDRIAKELTNGLPITFLASRLLGENFKKTGRVAESIVQTYLQVLAEFPDSLIAKKAGREKAKEVSRRAREIIKPGGLLADREEVRKFGKELKSEKNQLNPGTTADIIAVGIMIWLLKERFNYNLG